MEAENLTAADFDIIECHESNGDHRSRRRICTSGCERPINVCLCRAMPTEPITTRTRLVILHHPHEQHHKLATVPVVSKCLANWEVIVGRKLRYGDSGLLDALHDAALQNPNFPLRAIFLFPGMDSLPSVEINQWKSSANDIDANNYVLIAFDGTWKYAKEMVHASLPFLSMFAFQAYLNCEASVEGGTIFDSELILRKEPFRGCMSTMETIARCLRILEPEGVEIERRLIEVLRTMVKFQARFLKPMNPRPKLLRTSQQNIGAKSSKS